jgi:hypothetical protein
MSDTGNLEDRLLALDVKNTAHEEVALSAAYRLGGLDEEMDGIIEARMHWFTQLGGVQARRVQAMYFRVRAVGRLLDAIKMRRQAIEDREAEA